VKYRLRKFGDPILKTPATDVAPGEDITELLDAMSDILIRTDGLGISAQQVGSDKRVALMRIGGASAATATVAINLRITERSPEMQTSIEEGCLSVRNPAGWFYRRDVRRHAVVWVSYTDEFGTTIAQRLTGMDAIIAQHEADHLDGKCIADGTTREERKAGYRAAKKARRN